MNKHKIILFFLVSICSFSCGEGSGSGDKFSGRWKGQIFLSESTEGCVFQEIYNEEYQVSLEGNNVTVTGNSSPELQGELTSDSSFKVGFYVGSGLSPTSFELTFRDVDGNKAVARFTDSQGSFSEQTGLRSCSGTWEGEVRRD